MPYIIVRKGQGIVSPADLRHKRISLPADGTGMQLVALEILEECGLPEKEFTSVHDYPFTNFADPATDKDPSVAGAFVVLGPAPKQRKAFELILKRSEFMPIRITMPGNTKKPFGFWQVEVDFSIDNPDSGIRVPVFLATRDDIEDSWVTETLRSVYDRVAPAELKRLHLMTRDEARGSRGLTKMESSLHRAAQMYFDEDAVMPSSQPASH